MWSLEKRNSEPIRKAEIETDVESKCVDTKVGKIQWDELGDCD